VGEDRAGVHNVIKGRGDRELMTVDREFLD
jgi:hypothetical protein